MILQDGLRLVIVDLGVPRRFADFEPLRTYLFSIFSLNSATSSSSKDPGKTKSHARQGGLKAVPSPWARCHGPSAVVRQAYQPWGRSASSPSLGSN